MTKKEIESDIKEFKSLLADASVPEDEKALAREAIEELEEDLKKLEEKPPKKKAEKKESKPKTTVKAAKDIDPDCDDLLEQYKKRKERQKKSAKKQSGKSDAQKAKESVSKTTSRIKKKYNAGELSADQIRSIIAELKEDITELEKLLKSKESGKKKASNLDTVKGKIPTSKYEIGDHVRVQGHSEVHTIKDKSYRNDIDDNLTWVYYLPNYSSVLVSEKALSKAVKKQSDNGNKTYIVTYDFTKYKPKSASIKAENEKFREEIKAKNVDAVKAILKDSHNLNPFYFKIVEKKEKGGEIASSYEVKKLADRLKEWYGYEYEIDELVSEAKSKEDAIKRLKEFESDHKRHEDDERREYASDYMEKGGATCGCGGKLRKINYESGGDVKEEEIDYFEEYEKLPNDVREVLEKYNWGEDADYPVLEKMRKEVNKLGWDFEYYLDGVPYNLNKMSKAQRGMWIQRAAERMKQKGTEGAFAAQAKKAGMKTIPFAKHVLANKDKFSLTTVRRAQFVKNANAELFKDGGELSKLDPQQKKAIRSIVYNSDEDVPTIERNLKEKYRGKEYDLAHAYAMSMFGKGGKVGWKHDKKNRS